MKHLFWFVFAANLFSTHAAFAMEHIAHESGSFAERSYTDWLPPDQLCENS